MASAPRLSAPVSTDPAAAVTTWPPNWLRRAATTFIVGESSYREAKRANEALLMTGRGTACSTATSAAAVQRQVCAIGSVPDATDDAHPEPADAVLTDRGAIQGAQFVALDPAVSVRMAGPCCARDELGLAQARAAAHVREGVDHATPSSLRGPGSRAGSHWSDHECDAERGHGDAGERRE